MQCDLQALGRTKVVPNNNSQPLRGVFSIEPEADLSGATVFLETQHPGLTLNFDQPPKAYLASDLSDPAITPRYMRQADWAYLYLCIAQ